VESQLRALAAVARRDDATAEEVSQALADVGYQLFDQLLPARLQDLCWTFRQRGVQTILILSDEPHIPWELIKPFRMNPASDRFERVDDFWGEAFSLTHWLRGRPPVQSLSLRRVLAMAAGSVKPLEGSGKAARDLTKASNSSAASESAFASETVLPSADEELAVLRSLEAAGASVRVMAARRRHLTEAFERGEFDLLHLICHAQFGGTDTADASAVETEDGPFCVAELSPRLAGTLRSAAPLIFFNACHTGRLGFSLTRLGSWGVRLVQLGCGGFVGALWPVTVQAAPAFAQTFYEAIARGDPLGDAVRQARHRVRERFPSDPSWLAYCCFGDPLARVQKNMPVAGHSNTNQ
jgi:CHAT domain-containing protein